MRRPLRGLRPLARSLGRGGAGALALLALSGPAAGAHPGHGPYELQANGNSVTGGLAFTPAAVDDLTPGDLTRWTNTDSVSRHSATSAAWDLEMGPGEQRERRVEAGIHRYACRFHPSMTGVLTVTPFGYEEVRAETVRKRIRIKRRKGSRRPRYRYVKRTVFRYGVRADWAAAPGGTFDVERRLQGGRWEPWLTGTQLPFGRFDAREGQVWEIRARLRGVDFSPPVTVRVT
jgi:plastocyanin